MTEHATEVERLREEIAEREARIEALEAPMTRAEAKQLAAENPDLFNAKWEAARRAGRKPIREQG